LRRQKRDRQAQVRHDMEPRLHQSSNRAAARIAPPVAGVANPRFAAELAAAGGGKGKQSATWPRPRSGGHVAPAQGGLSSSVFSSGPRSAGAASGAAFLAPPNAPARSRATGSGY
jgi:hypothetical protein